MKKIFHLISALVFVLLSLTACSGETQTENHKLRIVSTVFPGYDFARAVAGDRADIKMLIKPGSESHSYEPSLTDVSEIKKCDIFIYIGGESDEWAGNILEGTGTDGMRVIAMTDCVELHDEETVEGMECETEDCDVNDADEHVWTTPLNAEIILNVIADAMIEADSENADYYRRNAQEYGQRLRALDGELSEIVENAKRKTLVFAERFPFRYLTEQYGLDYYAAFKGCSSSNEPTLATVSFLVNKVKEEKIPVVFYIEFSTETVADKICAETGAKKLLLHSCHNVTESDFNSGVTYIDLMEQNVNNLKEALS